MNDVTVVLTPDERYALEQIANLAVIGAPLPPSWTAYYQDVESALAKLRAAQPAQPGALERLEALPQRKWRWSLRRDDYGYTVYLMERNTVHEWNFTGASVDAAIDAALQAAQGKGA